MTVPQSQPAATSRAEQVDGRGTAADEPKLAALGRLRAEIGCVLTAPASAAEVFSSGSSLIDRWLPHGGLRVDAISEWIAAAEGGGSGAISLIAAAARLDGCGGPLVVVAGANDFYPPAATALGIAAGRIIWVRPRQQSELVWAVDQALRCQRVAAVWARVGANLDDRDARRLQLAAETGRTPGFLLRPASVRGCPSFADVRFVVSAGSGADHQRQVEVTLERCRGGRAGQSAWLRINDQAQIDQLKDGPQVAAAFSDPSGSDCHETAVMRLASELAHPTSVRTTRQRTVRRRGA